MPTPEANFWNTLKRNLPPNCFPTRIENRHGGGIPDVHFTWSGLMFWMELKTTKNNAVKLSPQQIAWNTAYSAKSGLNFILVKHLPSGDLILFRGSRAVDLARSGLAAGGEFRGSGHEELWEYVRESGISHLELILSGLRASGFGASTPGATLAQGTGAPVPGLDPGIEAKEKEA